MHDDQLDPKAATYVVSILPTQADTEAFIARLQARIRDLEAGIAARDEHIETLLTRVKHLTAVFS